MDPAWFAFIFTQVQLCNILFNICDGGKGHKGKSLMWPWCLMTWPPHRRGGPELLVQTPPGQAESRGPLGGSARPRQSRPSPESQTPQQGSEAQATQAWPAEPLPSPCPASSPENPPPRWCPRGPGLRKGVLRFLAEPSFLFFFQVDEVRLLLLLQRDMGARHGPTDPSPADGLRGGGGRGGQAGPCGRQDPEGVPSS